MLFGLHCWSEKMSELHKRFKKLNKGSFLSGEVIYCQIVMESLDICFLSIHKHNFGDLKKQFGQRESKNSCQMSIV